MKKFFIPLFVFLVLAVFTLTKSLSLDLGKIKIISVKEKPIIHIVPLGKIDKKYSQLVKGYIENFYGFKCVIDSPKPLTKDILASSGTRYEAGKILKKYDSDKNVLLLTDVDIAYFNKVKNVKEWGIIGLGLRPGKTCVVSTFRIKKSGKKKFLDRLRKVSIHEIGHNLGLEHCIYDKKCLMNDANGTVKQVDSEKIWLCKQCKSKIIW